MDKLPLFQMIIDENPDSEIGVSFVALVPKPAIEKNFMAFNSMKLEFSTDTERKIISGPAMVPDTHIYRRDDTGEYNVFFSKETIEQIALKFFKTGFQKNLNLFHDPTLPLAGVTIFESFVSDVSRGIQPMKGFEDLPDGTWFISAKVENNQIWEKIKAGEVKGFSVEGIFSYVKKTKTVEETISELLSRTYPEQGLLSKMEVMNSVKEMVANIKKTLFNEPGPAVNASGTTTTEYTLKDGSAVSIDKLEVGGLAMVAGVPAPLGEHELSDGSKITVGEAGLITAYTPFVAQSAEPEAKTPEQLIAAIKDTVAKFAAGTPEERLANLEVVTKALMDYSFGWEIRKAEEEATRTAAISVYKQGLVTTGEAVVAAQTAFEAFKTEMAAQFTAQKEAFEGKILESNKIIEAQKKQITSLFEVVEQIAEQPTVETVIENRTSFSAEKATKKENLRLALVSNISNLKKSKTA